MAGYFWAGDINQPGSAQKNGHFDVPHEQFEQRTVQEAHIQNQLEIG